MTNDDWPRGHHEVWQEDGPGRDLLAAFCRMIEAHGFFEGKGSLSRVEPLDVLGLIFGGG